MAHTTEVGRNDRCPCGSGKKYKACCARTEARASRSGLIAAIALVVLVLVAGVVLFQRITAEETEAPVCPEGQTWSVEHGHCH